VFDAGISDRSLCLMVDLHQVVDTDLPVVFKVS
jgi:hypothetical protein